MCIIIDACCANSLSGKDLPQSRLLLDWVKGGGRIVSGGMLEAELKGTGLQALLVAWSASGRLVRIDKKDLANEQKKLKKHDLRSNDDHILALARLSNANVIVTRDKPLMNDLKNKSHVGTPRKIYPFPDVPVTDLRVQRGVLKNAGCK